MDGVEYVVLNKFPGQRLGARAWYWHFRQYATSALGFDWSAVQPFLARCQGNVFMLHVADLLFTGRRQFWSQVFLPLIKQKFHMNFSELGEPRTEISFLKRRLIRVIDGLVIVPGTIVSKVVANFEQFFGHARLQKIPCDAAAQQDDSSQLLGAKDAKNYRNIIGILLYLSRDRVDIMFSVKELSSFMAAPTLCSVQRLRKLIGYRKSSGNIGIKLDWPEHGAGKWKKGTEAFWLLDGFTDAAWCGNKSSRRSRNCSVLFVNGCFVFASSGSQRVVSFSSAESDLHSMISGYLWSMRCHICEELFGISPAGSNRAPPIYTDNSAARQLISRQGVGRIRHPSAKLLWLQDLVRLGEVQVSQVPIFWIYSDVGTKNLSKSRLYFLLCGIGAVDPLTAEPIGQEEYYAAAEQNENRKPLSKLGKTIKRISLILGVQSLVSLVAETKVVNMCSKDIKAVEHNSSGRWFAICLLCFLVVILAVASYLAWRKFNKRLSEQGTVMKQMQEDFFHCWNQVADEDGYIPSKKQGSMNCTID